MGFRDRNQSEHELSKHVALTQLDTAALVELRATGRCTVALPEELFDLDYPGHYFRRIGSIAVSIPSVAGPYTSVDCKLSLQKSVIRTSPALRDGVYARAEDDDRFSEESASMEATVTSADSDMSGTDLIDQRYRPFEGAGVISEWQVEIPGGEGEFDYGTITDVILEVHYTAREGGEHLRSAALSHLETRRTC